MPSGRLYMIPNTIADDTQANVIPVQTLDALRTIRFFLAEDVRTARRYLSSLKLFDAIEALEFSVLNKNTLPDELGVLMAPLDAGHDVGVISESGCPGVADPGAIAVAYAHRKNIQVIPLVGPSSILLALMASGLNGQQFGFNGYLPVESNAIGKAIVEFEKESRIRNRTQIFIETPYRNNAVMKSLLTHLNGNTRLCAAVDLTSKTESVVCRSVQEWRQHSVNFPKAPAIFLFLA